MIIHIEDKAYVVSDSLIDSIVDEIQQRLANKENPADIWASVQERINNM